MYLSRLILNLRSRAVQQDLADCHSLHQRLMSGFPQAPNPGDGRAHFGVLYRLDVDHHAGRAMVLVQSQPQPNWFHLPLGYLRDTGGDPKNPDSKCVDQAYESLRAGSVLAFRVRANPTRKIDTKSSPDGQRRNGKRVELKKEEDQVQWLRRKGEGAFRLLSVRTNNSVANVRAVPERLTGFRRAQDQGQDVARRITVASVLFDGQLQVDDPYRFHQLLVNGIGPAKAYGCGLLSIAPLRQEVVP
ncbi:MAG: type I-E CRISPR-associated protein Cas6/Cse3/CasE [Chloroflexi bacterium]|nr:type I-E CRISPR-associated protein Cas6/Cse3/CasE [Chloroflexota bacterium]